MAINKNHLFEELDGIKCGIVEKDVSPDRVVFLKKLLEGNGFAVVTVPSPPPKAAPVTVVKAEDGTVSPPPTALPSPETFTVGVTDYTFNPINAIFGRLLHTPDGHVVTLAYWEQKEVVSHDEVPYFDKK
ncbi:MAG: hypothetical protein ABI358_14160 [Ginsengibacter sp.]